MMYVNGDDVCLATTQFIYHLTLYLYDLQGQLTMSADYYNICVDVEARKYAPIYTKSLG